MFALSGGGGGCENKHTFSKGHLEAWSPSGKYVHIF